MKFQSLDRNTAAKAIGSGGTIKHTCNCVPYTPTFRMCSLCTCALRFKADDLV